MKCAPKIEVEAKDEAKPRIKIEKESGETKAQAKFEKKETKIEGSKLENFKPNGDFKRNMKIERKESVESSGEFTATRDRGCLN